MATPTITNHDYRNYAQQAQDKNANEAVVTALQQYLQGQNNKDLLTQKGQQETEADKLKDYLQGQAQSRGAKLAQDMYEQQKPDVMTGQKSSVSVTPEGASISTGGGVNPMTQGGHENQALMRQYSAAVKPYQDKQAQSLQYMQDLMSGTMTGEKLAQIGKAAVASGGNVVSSRMANLLGATSQDFPGKFQDFLNHMAGQEHPDMTDERVKALGDALMLDVQKSKQQSDFQSQKFQKAAPSMAPNAAAMGTLQGVLSSFGDPNAETYQQVTSAYQNLKQGGQAQTHLQAGPQASAKTGGGLADTISNGLASFLRGGRQQSPAPAQAQPQTQPTPSQQVPGTQPQPQQQQAPAYSAMGAPGAQSQPAGKLRVKHKATGTMGTIDSGNPQDMQDLQSGVYEQVQ